MNKFEFKNLVKNLEKSLKERSFFKNLRKEVNTGAMELKIMLLKRVSIKTQLQQLDNKYF